MATSSPSTTLPWRPSLYSSTSISSRTKLNNLSLSPPLRPPSSSSSSSTAVGVVFRRGDFEAFKKRVTFGETWREAWRVANDGFEQVVYDAKKAADRFDRRYDVSRRISSAAEFASVRAREIDQIFLPSVAVYWHGYFFVWQTDSNSSILEARNRETWGQSSQYSNRCNVFGCFSDGAGAWRIVQSDCSSY
ncbi:hypothetical protein RND81_09G039000 [Saponaria officinalis]|uniref:Uncharacterized protein n=1 Tax=Saponaria officinalis TaxID=3572 RepID=A0AAW1IGF0_SAPOF